MNKGWKFFTSHGITSYLQFRVNTIVKSKKNTPPTVDQHHMLRTFRDKQSMLIRSNLQSGKSLAALVQSMDRAIKQHNGTTVIVVPNNGLIWKYKEWCESMMEEIVSRNFMSHGKEKPIWMKIGRWTLSSHWDDSRSRKSKPIPSGIVPSLLVVHADKFYQTPLENLIDVDQIIVDDMDYLISSASGVVVDETNKKLKLKLVEKLKALKTYQINHKEHYKPVQYCFICHNQPPQMVRFITWTNGKSPHTKDPIRRILNGLTKHTDDELPIGQKEREVMIIDSFNRNQFLNFRDEKNVHVSFLEQEPDGTLKSLDIVKRYPKKVKFDSIFTQIGEKSQFWFDQTMKQYFRDTRLKFDSDLNARVIKDAIKRIRTKNSEPILIVAPEITPSLQEALNNAFLDQEVKESFVWYRPELDNPLVNDGEPLVSDKIDEPLVSDKTSTESNNEIKVKSFTFSKIQDFFIEDPTTNPKQKKPKPDEKPEPIRNLLVPAKEVPGLDFTELRNILLLDGVQFPQSFDHGKYISGIKIPFNSLLYSYISKLKSQYPVYLTSIHKDTNMLQDLLVAGNVPKYFEVDGGKYDKVLPYNYEIDE